MKLLRRSAHMVLGGLVFLFGGIACILAFIPGLLVMAFASLADLLEEESLPYVPSPPDYESEWKVVEEPFEGGISLYRNGSRYTTQHSLVSLAHTGCSFECVPPEVMSDLRSRLPKTHGLWRELSA